jgi:hypothetical protein
MYYDSFYYTDGFPVPLKESAFNMLKERWGLVKNEVKVEFFRLNKGSVGNGDERDVIECIRYCTKVFKKDPVVFNVFLPATMEQPFIRYMFSSKDIDFGKVDRKSLEDAVINPTLDFPHGKARLGMILDALYTGDFKLFYEEADNYLEFEIRRFFDTFLFNYDYDSFYASIASDVRVWLKLKGVKESKYSIYCHPNKGVIIEFRDEPCNERLLERYWFDNVRDDLHKNPAKYGRNEKYAGAEKFKAEKWGD